MDILDSGSLKIQYNRNRYYDYYSGRWLTHDLLSYVDGMNLYEYARSSPEVNTDPYGFMTDSEFALKFIYHYFLGGGALWDKGADVVQRQESVKGTIGNRLESMAHYFCVRAIRSGGVARGRFNKVLHKNVWARDNIQLKITLNRVGFYIFRGDYEAKTCGWECPCTVKLKNVKHYWLDKGDLRLEKKLGCWPDWLVWFATRIGSRPAAIAHSLGLFAIDFPVRIKWPASNTLWKPMASVQARFTVKTGWPFDSGAERGEPDVGTPETPPRTDVAF